MRLFAYYIGHTFLNSLKKILKTWVAIFLFLLVFFGLIGFIAGNVLDAVVNSDSEAVEADDPDYAEAEDSQAIDEIEETVESRFGFMSALSSLPVNTLTELVLTAVLLLMLALCLFSSKGLEELFLPADVPLLFSAPVKPQAVMLFRLTANMGMQLVFSLVMAFQIPNLMQSTGFSLWGVVSILITWIYICELCVLLQLFLYILSSYSDTAKKNMKLYLLIFFGLIAAGYLFTLLRNGNDLVQSAVILFTGANTRWIPVFGWIRGFCIASIEGNIPESLLYLALLLASLGGIIALVWNLNVDYYEDALHAAERKAKKLAKANGNKEGLTERTRARSEKLVRDGFNHGSGANVYLVKALYNRFRFGWFHFVTITMLIYLGFSVFLTVLSRLKGFTTYGFVAVAISFCVVSFFRTLGNPLREDVTRDLFLMIPASPHSKLFYSVLGGLVNTALDLLLPYAIAIVGLSPSVAEAILWLVFVLTIDLYGTIVNTFIMLSVPITLPDAVQKTLQILFVYFGLLPALVMIVLGLITHSLSLWVGIGCAANLGISFLFFMLTPLFLQNGRK